MPTDNAAVSRTAHATPPITAPHHPAPSRRALWFSALKPPMYTVALTPMLIGSLSAYAETGVFSIRTLFILLQAAISVIAWLNLSNDVYDFDRSIDQNKPESVVNLCGATPTARNVILAVANVCLAAAFRSFQLVSREGGRWDPTVVVIMTVAVGAGYVYQGPPFRLGYLGLGEPITLVGWTLAVCAAYYAQLVHHGPTRDMLVEWYPTVRQRVLYVVVSRLCDRRHYLGGAAVLVAVPTAVILFCSHFHQHDDDLKAGKKSPIVRLGVARAMVVLHVVLVAFFLTECGLYAVGMVPEYPFYASFLALPYALMLAQFVRRNYDVPAAVKPAKYYAVKFHFVHGVCIGGGFLMTALKEGGHI